MKQFNRNKGIILALSFIAAGVLISRVYSHCQIPCGIYDDPARLRMIGEHITTIEKSMKQIQTLSKDSSSLNQGVRWVTNKERHSDAIIEIVTDYFLVQRLKPAEKGDAAYDNYISQLTLLHKMLRTSMLCKQTTDLQNVEYLRELLRDLDTKYQR